MSSSNSSLLTIADIPTITKHSQRALETFGNPL